MPLKTISIFCVLSDYFQIPAKLYFMFEWKLGVQSCLTQTCPLRLFCHLFKDMCPSPLSIHLCSHWVPLCCLKSPLLLGLHKHTHTLCFLCQELLHLTAHSAPTGPSIHTPLIGLCSSLGMNHWPSAKLPLPNALSHLKPFSPHSKPYTVPTRVIFSFLRIPSPLLALPLLLLSLRSLPWTTEESTGPGFPHSL